MPSVRSSLGVQRPSRHAVLQGEAVEILHGDEGLAVLLADVVNRADVGMIQGRRSLGLALEAGEGFRVLANFIGQELEGDKALEAGVFGLVDDAHPTTTEFFEYAVMRDCRVRSWTKWCEADA